MKHNCTIIDIDDDYGEVTIKVGEEYIVGFVDSGVLKEIGDEAQVEILLYDDLEISEIDFNKTAIERMGDSFSYSLYGILDVDNSILKSVIDFAIDREELYDYGYLHGKMVRIDVGRIDIDFC